MTYQSSAAEKTNFVRKLSCVQGALVADMYARK